MNILAVDIDKIKKELWKYAGTNNKMPYIICSIDTEKIIIAKCRENNATFMLDRYLGRNAITQYYGCTILNDNSLDLGEVDIR